jgi:hypothetical protein
MGRIGWVDANGLHGESEIDLDAAIRITPDAGGDLAASVACMIAEQDIDLTGYGQGEGPTLRILAPDYLTGLFQVATSRTVRVPSAPPLHRLRAADEGDPADAVRIGTSARRCSPNDRNKFGEVHRIVLLMTPADQVRNSYALLSNIYGHEIENGRDDKENQEIDCLRGMYDDGILHGNGFAVRSKLTDGIGFLVIDDLPEGGLSEEAVSGFGRTHGLALQTALAWDDEGRDVAACFVPIAFMDRVAEIIAAVADVARPEVPRI